MRIGQKDIKISDQNFVKLKDLKWQIRAETMDAVISYLLATVKA